MKRLHGRIIKRRNGYIGSVHRRRFRFGSTVPYGTRTVRVATRRVTVPYRTVIRITCTVLYGGLYQPVLYRRTVPYSTIPPVVGTRLAISTVDTSATVQYGTVGSVGRYYS